MWLPMSELGRPRRVKRQVQPATDHLRRVTHDARDMRTVEAQQQLGAACSRAAAGGGVMTTTSTGRRSVERTYSRGAVVLTGTAGIFMVMAGVFHFVQGLVALANDQFYVKTPDYVFQFDLTTWGWIHLVA